jgi:hypothetical protein
MTTLIAVYNSEGCVGRCDARCYNAEGDVCTCICGGANHGAGLNKAADNTRDLAESWLEAYGIEHEFDRADVLPTPVQLGLFA